MIPNKMNKQIKERWVEALRSGKYKQGHLALRKDVEGDMKYCCLGVLCDMYIQEHSAPGIQWVQSSMETNIYSFVHQESGTREDGLLPNVVQAWAELPRPVVHLKDSGKSPTCLTHLNDSKKLSFSQIATIIEEQL